MSTKSANAYLTLKEVIETEKIINDKSLLVTPELYLIINTINGTCVDGIFSSRCKAEMFMNRIAVNFSIDTYTYTVSDMVKDNQDISEMNFLNHVKETLTYYQILTIKHIDPNQPIYQIQTGNYMVRGTPTDYLTNSKDFWLSKQGPIKARNLLFGSLPKEFLPDDNKWLKDCTLQLDKELPELDLFDTIQC